VVNPVGTTKKLSVSVLVADKIPLDDKGKPGAPVPRNAEELKSIESMVASAIGIVPQRGDVINVLSMPFVDETIAHKEGDQARENRFYQYIPVAKYGLILLGMFLLYFLLIRPVIKTMKGEVQQHYKTVKQLEQEQQLQLPEEPLEPPPPVDEAIVALRREIQQNQIPTAFIIKNWIQEG
jgi:flagellar M-ring protein FliF